jgi:hypothetical protein
VELLLLTCFPKCGAQHMTHSQLQLLDPQLFPQLPKMMLCPKRPRSYPNKTSVSKSA